MAVVAGCIRLTAGLVVPSLAVINPFLALRTTGGSFIINAVNGEGEVTFIEV
jgi:hypothetical protein